MHTSLLERLNVAAFVTLAVLSVVGTGCDDGITSPPLEEEPAQTIDWDAAADSSSSALIDNYWNSQGQYFNYGNQGNTEFHYWPQAHALDVMLDAYVRTGDAKYENYIDRWYEGVPQKNGGSFLNDFYDDMEWNALAMLRAYEVTGEEKFKTAVDNLWEEIKTGWTDVAGGGIMWSKGTPRSKNAISNAPASVLASRLYQLTGEQAYLDWAKRIYSWQKDKLINQANGAVWDGVAVENGSEEINKDWIFTYNQGMFLAAALELYEITGEQVYLNDAVESADYTLNNLTTDAILKDEGAGDGGLFKGIFVRYFTQLILEEDLPASTRNRYVTFLEHNAETLWREGTNKSQVLFDEFWKDRPGSSEEIDLTVQLSGAMLVEAAALLESEDLLNNDT